MQEQMGEYGWIYSIWMSMVQHVRKWINMDEYRKIWTWMKIEQIWMNMDEDRNCLDEYECISKKVWVNMDEERKFLDEYGWR